LPAKFKRFIIVNISIQYLMYYINNMYRKNYILMRWSTWPWSGVVR